MPVLMIILLIVLGPTIIMALISLFCKISEKSEEYQRERNAEIRMQREEQRREAERRSDEAQRAALMPMVATETRDFIKKVQGSRAFDKIARVFLSDGVPYIFHVGHSEITCCDSSGRVRRRIRFVDLDLPDLVSERHFSQPINSTLAWRRVDALGLIKKEYPDLFGLSTRTTHYRESETLNGVNYVEYKAPCIDERIVVGILLCRKTGQVYRYQASGHMVEFKSTAAPPDTWQ